MKTTDELKILKELERMDKYKMDLTKLSLQTLLDLKKLYTTEINSVPFELKKNIIIEQGWDISPDEISFQMP